MLILVSAIPSRVAAISDAQKKVFGTGIYYFNTEQNLSSGCSGGSLPGEGNAGKIFNFFVNRGLTPPQAAGIIGNMSHESGFDLEPERLQGTSGKTPAETLTAGQLADKNLGWGIVQWTPPGKMINTFTPASDANDLSVQLEFLLNQLKGTGPLPEKQAGDDLKSTTNVKDAVLAFQGNSNVGGQYTGFERPADEQGSVVSRTGTAISVLARFGSGDLSTSSDTTSCDSSSSGQVVGNFSLPVDKKWYSQHPAWFTKPHHDYPAADIPVPADTPVYSIASGKVISAPVGGDCGQGVEIDAGGGILFLYCHGSDGGSIPGAKTGSQVNAGQLIMHSGYTGHVDPPGPAGAHLHVQITVNGQNLCPQSLLVAIAKGGDIPDIKTLPSSGCTI